MDPRKSDSYADTNIFWSHRKMQNGSKIEVVKHGKGENSSYEVGKYKNLVVEDLKPVEHSGFYYCINSNTSEVLNVHFVDIVMDTPLIMVITTDNAFPVHIFISCFPFKVDSNQLDLFTIDVKRAATQYGLEIRTVWQPWSNCDRCNQPRTAERRRRGPCMITV